MGIDKKEDLYIQNLGDTLKEFKPGKWGIARPMICKEWSWRIRAAFEVLKGKAGIFRWY